MSLLKIGGWIKVPLLAVFIHCRLSGNGEGSVEIYREIAIKAIICQNDGFEM